MSDMLLTIQLSKTADGQFDYLQILSGDSFSLNIVLIAGAITVADSRPRQKKARREADMLIATSGPDATLPASPPEPEFHASQKEVMPTATEQASLAGPKPTCLEDNRCELPRGHTGPHASGCCTWDTMLMSDRPSAKLPVDPAVDQTGIFAISKSAMDAAWAHYARRRQEGIKELETELVNERAAYNAAHAAHAALALRQTVAPQKEVIAESERGVPGGGGAGSGAGEKEGSIGMAEQTQREFRALEYG